LAAETGGGSTARTAPAQERDVRPRRQTESPGDLKNEFSSG
jgi:hypothetical protein